mgnify:FL=1
MRARTPEAGHMAVGCPTAILLCMIAAILIARLGGKLFPAWSALPWWAKAIAIGAGIALLAAGAAYDEATRWPKVPPDLPTTKPDEKTEP